MRTFTIGWLNKCRCGNKSHAVKTARGNESALWDDDAVKCNSCGRGGVIQVCEGQARVLWETDEEMAEGKPMSTLTKEWLLKTIAELEEERDATPGAVNEDAAMALAAMKLALASLEANGTLANEGTITATQFKPVADLYGLTSPTGSETSFTFDAVEARDFVDGGWSCQEYVELERFQKALLQGAELVTTAYKLPANTPFKEAPEHIWLQTAGVWPENGEYSELTWCIDNQHTDDTLYFRADVVADNCPVIPDGWVACSERMPEDEQEVITHNIFGYRHVSFFDEHSGHFFDRLDGSPVDCVEHVLVSHWMPLPAAPQQEVK